MTEELERMDLLMDTLLLARLKRFAPPHGTTVEAVLIQTMIRFLDESNTGLNRAAGDDADASR
ncbi:hypothetical protein [uncultured Paraburkholderia sp.]|uniref:hypothetical protein n=1 Tax=uncultured Paraburkholderia sp. TaxID=1822466 RepID=UPI00259291A2|nr:hypothetical protein [uncultured Paraburkholderia sp.]